MANFDIRKTFEIFLREPLSVLTEGLFQIVNLKTNIFSNPPSENVDFINKKTQKTVVHIDPVAVAGITCFKRVYINADYKSKRKRHLNETAHASKFYS